jgi:site-specific DNA-cytosine methylase
MKYLSVCSGIEAATVAWQLLGWEAFAYSEIEKFPCQVLEHHYPDTPNLGDMTKFQEWPDAIIDVLVGGTPCQSFSIAGLRAGLDDPRGNLMLTFGSIAAKYRSKWLVWENVFGVLSSNGGKDFASFLGLITGRTITPPRNGWGNSWIIPGYKNAYGVAYRVLDAQYFGVAQRRRRVFVVGCIGDWRSAAAVLFERDSLSGNPAPIEQWVYPTLDASVGWKKRYANQWAANGFGIVDGNGRVRCPTINEWECLQGFHKGYIANIDWHGSDADFLRRAFAALGNSMAVPVMEWIGQRIQAVESVKKERVAA